jgi:AcrR family transcriptional regulator
VSNGDDTRHRILESAFGLVRERGAAAVTVSEIAHSAGVSRQLVYFHFANRAGLLVAMARHHDVRSGFAERTRTAAALPAAEALEALLDAWHAYVPDILPVAQALEAAVMTGEDGADAWRDRMGALRETFRAAIERLAAAGRLADGWTVDAAADWAWARCQPTVWRHLVGERGWAADAYARRATASILAELVAPTNV